MFEELERTSVRSLLDQMEPGPFESWDCSPKLREKLDKLDPNTRVIVYGSYSFRLADDYPSYYVHHVVELYD